MTDRKYVIYEDDGLFIVMAFAKNEAGDRRVLRAKTHGTLELARSDIPQEGFKIKENFKQAGIVEVWEQKEIQT